MARGGHALPFYILRATGLRLSSTPLDTPRRTPVERGVGRGWSLLVGVSETVGIAFRRIWADGFDCLLFFLSLSSQIEVEWF
jgi:hypothetical protein